jgi:hypothetical protein
MHRVLVSRDAWASSAARPFFPQILLATVPMQKPHSPSVVTMKISGRKSKRFPISTPNRADATQRPAIRQNHASALSPGRPARSRFSPPSKNTKEAGAQRPQQHHGVFPVSVKRPKGVANAQSSNRQPRTRSRIAMAASRFECLCAIFLSGWTCPPARIPTVFQDSHEGPKSRWTSFGLIYPESKTLELLPGRGSNRLVH